MTINELKKYGIELLNKNNIQDSIVIVNILLEFCLNISKHQLIINSEDIVSKENELKFIECINRRINNEPLEYITNKKEFMNCELYVNENVLVPRSDTEVLVENLIDILLKEFNNIDKIEILELCTGSGCIPVGTLMYIKDKYYEIYEKLNFICVDISKKALEVAKINAQKYDLNNKIKFIESDLFENLPNIQYDIIISNPPYIETDVISSLNSDVKNEPIIALDGGNDGLYFYNKISEQAKIYLKDKGYIIYEIGYNQGEKVTKILENNSFRNIEIKKDLSSNDRNIIAIK
ncbi:MAG: peptide chain release factor N(5)-glutamine methyltransferase [Clostridiales bacterium]|nr:peptide chain release factor N(5)-glutamine methyltransferase [Clostridiales bacterium]